MSELKKFFETKKEKKGIYLRIRRDLMENPISLNEEIEIKGLSVDFDGNGWGQVLGGNINEKNRLFRKEVVRVKILENIYDPKNSDQHPFLLKDENDAEFGIILL
jgi:hypothetical protein